MSGSSLETSVSLSVLLFIWQSTLKSTFLSSPCCCCISSYALFFLGLDSECTLVPFPNTYSFLAFLICCLSTSIESFLTVFSHVGFFIFWLLTLTDSFLNAFSSVAWYSLSLSFISYHLCVKWRVCWSLDKQELVVSKGAVKVGLELFGEFLAILLVPSLVCDWRGFSWGASRMDEQFSYICNNVLWVCGVAYCRYDDPTQIRYLSFKQTRFWCFNFHTMFL